jgi:hypothetical protein
LEWLFFILIDFDQKYFLMRSDGANRPPSLRFGGQGKLIQLPNSEIEQCREADPKNVRQQQIRGSSGYPIKAENVQNDGQP